MFTALTAGYGGYLKMKDDSGEYITLMQSYNLSMTQNYLDSTANNRFWDYTNERYDRYRGLTLKDYSTYEFSVTFDATARLYNMIMDWIINHPHQFKDITFSESNFPSVSYNFDQAYITGADFTVGNNSTLVINVTFLVVNRDINLDYGEKKTRDELYPGFFSTRLGRVPNSGDGIVGNVLMPYWKFKIKHDEYPEADILSFSWRFSQQATPKFGCQGQYLSNIAQDPMKIVFSNAEMSFEMTCLVNGMERDIDSFSDFQKTYGRDNMKMQIYYGSESPTIKCQEVKLKTYTPSIGDHSNYSTVSFSGDVYGRIDFVEISETEQE